MKKILLLLIVAATMIGAGNAQTSVQPKWQTPERIVSAYDTNTNSTTTYVTFPSVASRVKGIQATVNKISGTVAGTVLLQGTVDGVAWVNVNTDTLTLANQAVNSKVWVITSTAYNSYRVAFGTTGTQVSYLQLAYIRRPDE